MHYRMRQDAAHATLTSMPRRPASTRELAELIDDATPFLVGMWTEPHDTPGGHISSGQLRVLMAVAEHGTPTISGLATDLGLSTSSASRLCDRLEAAGWLAREPGYHDRRQIRVALTRHGQRLLADLAERRQQALAAVLKRMSRDDRAFLEVGLRAFQVAARRPLDAPAARRGRLA
jgi:DNA-binding MarR family transcriptional regulator